MMGEIRTSNFGISSLFNLSIRKLTHNFKLHENRVEHLPPSIKTRIVSIVSKRGLLDDSNIFKCLHSQLTELDLSECEITDQGLLEIGQTCNLLTKLDLNSARESRTAVTDRGVSEVARGCRRLQILFLRRCLHIGDDAISEVALHCKNLRFLNVGGCLDVTDKSLHALAENCALLQCLNVSHSKITDAGVFKLSQGQCRTTLSEFHMAGCPEITDEAVEAITECCPKIRILIFHGCPRITESSRIALEQLLARSSEKLKQISWTIY